MTTPRTTTIEQERQKELEEYRQALESDKEEPLKLVSEDKEEPSKEEESFVEHGVAVAEASAGKIQLPKGIPIKTFRLDLDRYNAYFSRKFYRVKLDYDLYLEVNADHPAQCVKKVLEFAKTELKGMLPLSEEDMEIEEILPNFRDEAERSYYDLS